MNIIQIISLLMLVTILMNMLAKSRPYSKKVITGKTISVIPLGILSKIWLQRFNLTSLTTGLLLLYWAKWLPLNLVLMVAAFALVIPLLPMRLTITSQGMAFGDAFYRRWNEFNDMKYSKFRVELKNKSILSHVVIFLNTSKNLQVVKYIENHISAI